MSSCSTDTLLNLSSCYACLTPGQLQLVNTALLCRIMRLSNPMASCDVNTLLADANQFASLTHFQLAVIQTQLLCDILQAGGGGSSAVCLICGQADPTEPAVCDCSLYYRTDNGQFWYWDYVGNAWVKFIS